MQSRYYNPEWGRFINADGIVGVTGELLSANMFTYCLNNPINMHDNDGERPDYGDGTGRETDEQRAASLASMTKVNKKSAKKSNSNQGTVGYGRSYEAEAGIRFAINIEVVTDSHDNKRIIISPSCGGGTLGYGKSYTRTKTNAVSINDLKGFGMDTGASISLGIPVSVGSDYVASPNGVRGYNINVGGKMEPFIEAHLEITYTWVIPIPFYNKWRK